MERILLVEDDRSIISSLTAFLQEEGFEVMSASGQQEALALLEREGFDLALLDVSLREGNGFALCSAIKKNSGIPVIFLTASSDEYSVVAGLELGADDYVAKPFRPRELVCRIRNAMRRVGRGGSLLELGDVRVDPEKGSVTKGDKELLLTALEYRLLLIFLNHRGEPLSRERLLEELWDAAGEYVNDNTLTVYIKRLREKIEDSPQEPTLICTLRGFGYKAGE